MTAAVVLDRALEAVRHLCDANPPWEEILQCSRQVVGGDSASFILLDGNSELLTLQQCNVSEAAVAEYTDHYYISDIVTPQARGAMAGTWLDSSEIFPRAVLERSDYYVDFMCRHRMRQMLTFIVEESPSRRGGLTVQRDVPVANARQILESESVRMFTDALQAAVRKRRTEAQRILDASDFVFHSLGEAACLVSARGSVIQQTPTARHRMFELADLTHRDGRLWHPRVDVRSQLELALAEAVSIGGKASIAIPGANGCRCVLDMVRADGRLSMGNEALVLVRLRIDQGAKRAAAGVMGSAFGLTPAEQRVLAALAAGQSPADFARVYAVSINTVRRHIAVLMEKMDCHRQVDLVRKALGEQ